jgi:undecaprenyl-diphosphatase
MDLEVFRWFNSWNGAFATLDVMIGVSRLTLLKSMPFMLAFWGLWFWPATQAERTRVRNGLTATLLLTVPIIGITRAVANYAPHSPRPIHTPDLEINLFDGQNVDILDGWSSMPSDHASLFMGLAVAIFAVHRGVGAFLIFWAIVVSSIPRVVLGLHWPSDVLVGWLLGATIALVFIGVTTRLVARVNIVPFFESREALGYPLLFLGTFEVAQMFDTTRRVLFGLLT